MPDRILRGLNGPRGTALLAAAWVCVFHGVAYTPLTAGPQDVPLALELLAGMVPLEVYGAAWFTAGIVALLGAFRTRTGKQRDNLDAWGHSLVVAMFITWGGTYLAGWVIAEYRGDPSRSWITAALYVGIACIVGAGARMTNPTGRKVAA